MWGYITEREKKDEPERRGNNGGRREKRGGQGERVRERKEMECTQYMSVRLASVQSWV